MYTCIWSVKLIVLVQMENGLNPRIQHPLYEASHTYFGWRSERNYATCKSFWATTWIEMYARIAYIWELLTQLCVLPAELIKSKINTSGKLLPPQHVNPSFWKGFVSFCNIVLHRYPIANWCCNSSPFLSSPAPELQLDMPLFILPGNKWLSVNILKMTKHVFSDLVWQNGKFLWLYTIVW